MKILGITASFGHIDVSSMLLVNGKIIAAVEEEGFIRKKHPDGQLSCCKLNEYINEKNRCFQK